MDRESRPKLVAETDAVGRVTHVWISMPDWKFARPVGQTMLQDSVLARSEIHGASRKAVTRWLEGLR